MRSLKTIRRRAQLASQGVDRHRLPSTWWKVVYEIATSILAEIDFELCCRMVEQNESALAEEDFERCVELAAENERLARRVQRWPMVMTTPRGWESPELLAVRLMEGVRS